MSVRKTSFYFCMAILFAIAGAFPYSASAQVQKVQQIVKIEKDTLRMYVGQEDSLRAYAYPSARVFYWDNRVSIPVVASIAPPHSTNPYDSVYIVKAWKPGKTVIVVRVNEVAARCIVVVTPKIYVDSLRLKHDTIRLRTGDTASVMARIFPYNASDKKLGWTTVGGARVLGTTDSVTRVIAAADADTSLLIVGALDESGKRDTCVIITRRIPVERLTLNHDTIRMDINKTDTLRASIFPLNATDQRVKWTVASGAVKALAVDSIGQAAELIGAAVADTALVVAEAADGRRDSCVVITINPNHHPNAAVEVDETIAVHGVDGGVMVHVDRPVRLEIYTLTGALTHRESLTPGDRFVPLRRGLYIVAVDRTRRKILVQ